MTVAKISVVCPTYNSAAFIEKTLASVFSQSLPVYEIIISDDGSTDRTLEIVESIFQEQGAKFKCKLLKNSHKGPGSTRNMGIRSAQGEWIAFLDSDDIWLPEKIEQVTGTIKQNSKVNFICHNENRVNQKKGTRTILKYGVHYRRNKPLFNQLYFSNLFSTSAIVCKKSLLLEKGLFDTKLMSAQDYELWLRLSPYIIVHFIDCILGEYVEREGNITSGSLKRRMKNEMMIAYQYRDNVSYFAMMTRIFRIFGSYIKQYINRNF